MSLIESLRGGVTTMNIPISFLEATGNQYISIPVTIRGTDDEVFAVDTDIQFTDHTSRMLMGFSTSVGAYWGVAANLAYYDFGGSSYAIKLDPSVRRVVHFQRVNRNGTLSVGSEEITRAGAASLSNLPWSIFSTGGTSNACRAKLYGAKITEDSVLTYDLIPCLDPLGVPCMFNTVTHKLIYNSGTGSFIAGMTTDQAVNLATLPATGGSLTVSLPLAAAFDDKIQSVLNAAADKGWTITVQYRESELTTENIEADFLENDVVQYIDTGIEVQPNLSFDLDFQVARAMTGNSQAYYIFGGFGNGLAYSWGLFQPQSTDDGWCCQGAYNSYWNAPAFAYEQLMSNRYKLHLAGESLLLDGVGLSIGNRNSNASYTGSSNIALFTYFNRNEIRRTGSHRVFSFAVSHEGKPIMQLIPCLDNKGIPSMYDTLSGQNFYNQGSGSFIVGFDTTEKAAVSLSKLPVTTAGTLTVSLPAAAQDTGTLVPAAIDIATSRGWTIITQYRED